MCLFAKFGGHRSYRNGDINSYINSHMHTLTKIEHTAWIPHIVLFTANKKKKKNTGNFKAFCVSRNHKKQENHSSVI